MFAPVPYSDLLTPCCLPAQQAIDKANWLPYRTDGMPKLRCKIAVLRAATGFARSLARLKNAAKAFFNRQLDIPPENQYILTSLTEPLYLESFAGALRARCMRCVPADH